MKIGAGCPPTAALVEALIGAFDDHYAEPAWMLAQIDALTAQIGKLASPTYIAT